MKHVGMPQSATPATRNEATRSGKTPKISKNDPFCRTCQRHSHSDLARTVANGCERLRTVADGCGRLRTVANGWGRLRTVAQRLENTALAPHPQSEIETGILATHSGKSPGLPGASWWFLHFYPCSLSQKALKACLWLVNTCLKWSKSLLFRTEICFGCWFSCTKYHKVKVFKGMCTTWWPLCATFRVDLKSGSGSGGMLQ